jgi:hypothetical protein
MSRIRRLTRLESLARVYLHKRQNTYVPFAKTVRKEFFAYVANLSALILYGNPQIDEPLDFAWRRCLESSEWQARREKYGGWDEYGRERGSPFNSDDAGRIADYFRKYFLPDLPGADEIEKLSAIFRNAPPWLVWFTHGDVKAGYLGIELPDLSGVNGFMRGRMSLFGFPAGPFECHPVPDGIKDEVAVHEKEARRGTPRKRKRTIRIYETYK